MLALVGYYNSCLLIGWAGCPSYRPFTLKIDPKLDRFQIAPGSLWESVHTGLDRSQTRLDPSQFAFERSHPHRFWLRSISVHIHIHIAFDLHRSQFTFTFTFTSLLTYIDLSSHSHRFWLRSTSVHIHITFDLDRSQFTFTFTFTFTLLLT